MSASPSVPHNCNQTQQMQTCNEAKTNACERGLIVTCKQKFLFFLLIFRKISNKSSDGTPKQSRILFGMLQQLVSEALPLLTLEFLPQSVTAIQTSGTHPLEPVLWWWHSSSVIGPHTAGWSLPLVKAFSGCYAVSIEL